MDNQGVQFKFGRTVSFLTAVTTSVAFVMAVLTPPLSGPWCEGKCFQYPFSDIAERFPRDYYWMFPAMLSFLFYMAMMASLHQASPNHKKHFSLLGMAFSMMATLVLFSNYFIQVSVIQPSVMAGEQDGIALLSQYNAHGIFIVLEEIGFLFICFSFVCCIPVFSNQLVNGKAMKWTAMISFAMSLISFILISGLFGIQREYRFEIAVISIMWLEIIVMSLLLARFFKSGLKY